jgi:hypothetical protein
LEEDLSEEHDHSGVADNRFLEREYSRLMLYILTNPIFGVLKMLIEEGLMDLATFREPSTVAAEDCRRRRCSVERRSHCSVERYQQVRERGEERNSL